MKRRIASYYESRLGRNDGNPLFVTHVLKRDYADAMEFHHLIPDPALQFDLMGRFDGHLWIDWGEDALTGLLPYKPIACPKPGAYWVSDTHLGYDYRLAKAREFDWVFCAQQRAVDEFRRDGITVPVAWLPHAVEPEAYNPAAIYAATPEQLAATATVHRMKRWDTAFVGHLNTPERVEFLDTVFRAFPNSWFASRRTGRSFERAADVYTRAKLVWNPAVRDDLNMRVFEVLATRTCLITSAVPTLDALFTDGVHLVTYRTLDEAIEKAHYYLTHDDEREAIADAGYREVLARHTFRHRVSHMLTTMGVLNGHDSG